MNRTTTFIKAKSTPCQWCGWVFDISMSPFNAVEFRKWADTVKQHKVDCKEAFLKSPSAVNGLNECGMHYLQESQ